MYYRGMGEFLSFSSFLSLMQTNHPSAILWRDSLCYHFVSLSLWRGNFIIEWNMELQQLLARRRLRPLEPVGAKYDVKGGYGRVIRRRSAGQGVSWGSGIRMEKFKKDEWVLISKISRLGCRVPRMAPNVEVNLRGLLGLGKSDLSARASLAAIPKLLSSSGSSVGDYTSSMIPQVYSPKSFSPMYPPTHPSQPQINHSSVPPSHLYQSQASSVP
ncbi:hypothetical protein Tco_0439403 [Tanacetum coccineum]